MVGNRRSKTALWANSFRRQPFYTLLCVAIVGTWGTFLGGGVLSSLMSSALGYPEPWVESMFKLPWKRNSYDLLVYILPGLASVWFVGTSYLAWDDKPTLVVEKPIPRL